MDSNFNEISSANFVWFLVISQLYLGMNLLKHRFYCKEIRFFAFKKCNCRFKLNLKIKIQLQLCDINVLDNKNKKN